MKSALGVCQFYKNLSILKSGMHKNRVHQYSIEVNVNFALTPFEGIGIGGIRRNTSPKRRVLFVMDWAFNHHCPKQKNLLLHRNSRQNQDQLQS